MSIGVMEAVLKADFPKYIEWEKNGKPRRTKSTTAKILLLCYADKSNEEGEGTYPGYNRLKIETGNLSDQGLADTIEALKQNTFLVYEGRSKYNTNSYKVNIEKLKSMCHPVFLKPLEKRDSSHLRNETQATRENPLVKPSVKPNGAKAQKEKSYKPDLESAKERIEKQRASKGDILDFFTQTQPEIKIITEMRERVSAAVGLNLTREWDKTRSDWNGYEKKLIKREVETGETIEQFMEWYNSDEFRRDNQRIWLKPDVIEKFWPSAFSEQEPDRPEYKKVKYNPEDDKKYAPPPETKPRILRNQVAKNQE